MKGETNCYKCEVRMPRENAVKKMKGGNGDVLIFCVDCSKETFKRKKKLIKRV